MWTRLILQMNRKICVHCVMISNRCIYKEGGLWYRFDCGKQQIMSEIYTYKEFGLPRAWKTGKIISLLDVEVKVCTLINLDSYSFHLAESVLSCWPHRVSWSILPRPESKHDLEATSLLCSLKRTRDLLLVFKRLHEVHLICCRATCLFFAVRISWLKYERFQASAAI
jgi:hypothetical protein